MRGRDRPPDPAVISMAEGHSCGRIHAHLVADNDSRRPMSDPIVEVHDLRKANDEVVAVALMPRGAR
jgi:hypothetical protein